MRAASIVCVSLLSLSAVGAARAERLLLTPLTTQGGVAAAVHDEVLRKTVVTLGSVEVVGRQESADVLAAVSCDGTLGCTVVRGTRANATAVLLGRVEAQDDAVKVVMSLIDVPAQSERSRVEVAGKRADAERLVQRAAVQLLAPDRYVGALRVALAEPGAEVWVDGNLVGSTPLLAAIALPPARHEVEVRLAGLRPFKKFVDVRFDEAVALELVAGPSGLVEQEAPAQESAPAAADGAQGGGFSPSPMLIGGSVAAGVGAVALGAGGVLSVLAFQSKQRWESGAGTREDIQANRIQSPLGAALLGAGGVLLLGGAAAVGATFAMAPAEPSAQ